MPVPLGTASLVVSVVVLFCIVLDFQHEGDSDMPRKKVVPKLVEPSRNQQPHETPAFDADLVRLAGSIPAELLQQMDSAIRSGRWLFAVWRIDDGRIHLDRTAVDFPTVDLEKAVQLLSDNLRDK